MYARDMFVPAIIASGGGNVNSALRPPRATRDTLLASLDSFAGTQGYYKIDRFPWSFVPSSTRIIVRQTILSFVSFIIYFIFRSRF